MIAQVIQAKYETIEEIGERFTAQSEACQQTTTAVRGRLSELQAGGWQGIGSAAFFAEMDSSVLPAMGRLSSTLTTAGRVLFQIIDVLRKAEEEAAQPFQGGNAFAIPQQVANVANLAGNVGATTTNNKGTQGNAAPELGFFDEVFEDAKRQQLVKAGFPQADSQLKSADPAAIQRISAKIAEARQSEIQGAQETLDGERSAAIPLAASFIAMEEAVNETIKAYNIDVSNVASVNINPYISATKYGDTNSSGGVAISAATAFDSVRIDGNDVPLTKSESQALLAAVVLHEVTHADQYTAHKVHGRVVDSKIGSAKLLENIDEAEAYHVVLQNRKMLGLSPTLETYFTERYDEYVNSINNSTARNLVENQQFEKARRYIDPGNR